MAFAWLKFRMYRFSWVALVSFAILFFLDLYSTLRVGPLVEHLESNPLYPLGGFPLIIFINIFWIAVFLLVYSFGRPVLRYFLITIFVGLSFFRVKVIQNNFLAANQVATGVITEEWAKSLTYAEKTMSLYQDIWLVVLAPAAYLLIIYGLFVLDHVIKRRNCQK